MDDARERASRFANAFGGAWIPVKFCYVYECEKCGHTFERFRRMNDPRIKNCPKCSGEVRRLVGTGAGIIFKGAGFHATDYGRSGGDAPPCGSGRTCCGRDTRCDSPPCKD